MVTNFITRQITSAIVPGNRAEPTPSSPAFAIQPSSQSAEEGQAATFYAVASGYPSPTYQWQLNSGAGFSNISGATGTSYTTPTLTLSDDGNLYRCVVTNSEGSATSNAATLTVTGGGAPGSGLSYNDLAFTYNDLALSYE